MSIENLNNFVVPVEFACTIINEKLILSNAYHIRISINPSFGSSEDISIGFQRIKHIVNNYLSNSILINKDNKLVKELSDIENNVVYLPCEPYDLFVGAVLLSKFTTITEKYFEIEYLTVESIIGEHVQYAVSNPYDCNIELDGDYWWNSDTVSTGHRTVVTWDELNLTQTPRFQPTLVQGGLSERK
jgi:hypothetical protein